MAVLIDATKYHPTEYIRLEPQLRKLGDPVLRRYFVYERSSDWKAFAQMEQPERRPQLFQVDNFMPINIQIAADAVHIAECCDRNQLKGLCFVVGESDVPSCLEVGRRIQVLAPSMLVRVWGKDSGLHASKVDPSPAGHHQNC
jgi:hypothetical protein